MADSRRVVLIGKSGSGKSSLANTIFGSSIFSVNHSSESVSRFSEARTGTVDGLSLTLIDTPGIFNTDRTDDEVACEIFSCLTRSSPGPHAFLIVLLVEKFTEQEQDLVDQIKLHFGEGVFQYATVVFTHGDQLAEGMKITEFVSQSRGLNDLIQQCGGRCHVIDNKYWKSGPDLYRSNRVQVEKILNSIQITVEENNGGFFTNEQLRRVERDLQIVQNRLQSAGAVSLEASREQAQRIVLQKYISRQKWRRYARYVGIAGLSVATLVLILPRVLSYFRGRPATQADHGADASSVFVVVQEAVAPIKSTLDYIIETIEAIFMTRRSSPPNRTLTESE